MLNSNDRSSIVVISISGKKNTGKTTLIENLIPLMIEKGWTVCTIKHHHYGDYEPDTPGKDSHRHYKAGAQGVALVSPNKLSYFEKQDGKEPDLRNILKYFPLETNLVLIEGYHNSIYPHIEVSRKEISTELITDTATPLIAVIADYEPAVSVPVFQLNEYNDLADFLDNFLKNEYGKMMKKVT